MRSSSLLVSVLIGAAVFAEVPREGCVLWLEADTLSASHKSGDAVTVWKAVIGPQAVRTPMKLVNNQSATAPVFIADAVNGSPAVRFDGSNTQLSVLGNVISNLAGTPFSIFMISRSTNSTFGICGNSSIGGGGVPRFYVQRHGMFFSEMKYFIMVNTITDAAELLGIQHDGANTLTSYKNGILSKTLIAAIVPAYGGDGNISIPFWPANQPQPGDIALILIYNRYLSEAERTEVERIFTAKYKIR
ncbi:MAG: hypothetical protein AABZ39_01405 [Spirochaetota bacterium]